MGKKRRLKSAKAKFGIKHSAHPRAKLLATMDTEEKDTQVATIETKEKPTVTMAAIEEIPAPEQAPELKLATHRAPTPKKKVEKTAATATPKTTTKKTTKSKKTTPAKKTTTTRKRSTKTNSTTATA